jgi:hypothetical protein
VFSSVPRSVWTMASPPPAHNSSHLHDTKHDSRTSLHFEHERGRANEWAEVAWSLTYGFVRKDLKSKDDFALNYNFVLNFLKGVTKYFQRRGALSPLSLVSHSGAPPRIV